jgi:p-aminobenzoyl-glutamate transporter AbgT
MKKLLLYAGNRPMKRLFVSLPVLVLATQAYAGTIHVNGGTDPELAIFLTIVGTVVLTVVATFVVRTLRKP